MSAHLTDGVPLEVIAAIHKVRLIAFDFDGVFTNNAVYVTQDGIESVRCSRSDGLGLRRLDAVGVRYYIVSTETNPVVATRAKKLKMPATHGHEDKLAALKNVADEYGVGLGEVAYVGNDINDEACLKAAGLPIVVADAYPEVAMLGKYRTRRVGGDGAVREICDLVYSVRAGVPIPI